jgi:2-oxoglutarate ferredoxin oxidoreductase subunit beta
LDVLQPCPTYNNLHNKDWYAGKDRGDRPRVYALEEGGYDPVITEGADEATVLARMSQVIEKAMEWGDRIPTGVFLENRNVSTFAQRLAQRSPSYQEQPPALRAIADDQGRPLADLAGLFAEKRVSPGNRGSP